MCCTSKRTYLPQGLEQAAALPRAMPLFNFVAVAHHEALQSLCDDRANQELSVRRGESGELTISGVHQVLAVEYLQRAPLLLDLTFRVLPAYGSITCI